MSSVYTVYSCSLPITGMRSKRSLRHFFTRRESHDFSYPGQPTLDRQMDWQMDGQMLNFDQFWFNRSGRCDESMNLT